MSLRKGTKLKKVTINVVFNSGGLGDFVCRIPVLKKIVSLYPQVNIKLWSPEFFMEIARYFLVAQSSRIEVLDRKNFKKEYNGGPLYEFNDHKIKTFALNLMQHTHLLFFSQLMSNDEIVYPQFTGCGASLDEFNLPDKYVVLTTEATAETRTLKKETVQGLINYFYDKVPVVFLGKRELFGHYESRHIMGLDYSQGIDLREKTTLMQAAEILNNAQCVLGLDNGLLHLACCTKANVVFGFSTVRPEDRICGRTIGKTLVVEPSSDCKYCQASLRFIEHDFRFCFYKERKLECLDSLTAKKFIEAYEKCLT